MLEKSLAIRRKKTSALDKKVPVSTAFGGASVRYLRALVKV